MLTSLFPRAHRRFASLAIVGGVLDDFCQWLQARGYPRLAIRRRVAATPYLEQLLRHRRVGTLGACTAADVKACLHGPTTWATQGVGALGRSLIAFLEERGQLAATPSTATERLAGAFLVYLTRVRGLASGGRYVATAKEFLQFHKYDAQPCVLRRLTSVHIEDFLTHVGRRVGRVTMQHVVSGVKTFLRFLATHGDGPVGLDGQIDSPRCYRQERLPRALPWADVVTLLGTIDRTIPKGRRDYAMLVVIATYGLRISEVAGLDLDDVAWRARQLRVARPKVGTSLLLPLTDDVATAVLDYLRHGRPASTSRRLFLRVRAPGGPIQPSAIGDAFDAWAARAGLGLPQVGGPHCLRHAVAMHLLRQATPLKTIGDLLGHRSVESTNVYLRLDVEDLRDVALSVPLSLASEVRS